MVEVPEVQPRSNKLINRFLILVVVVLVAYAVARNINKRHTISGLRSSDSAARTRSIGKLNEWKLLTDAIARQPIPVKRELIPTLRDMNTDVAADQLILLMKDRSPVVQSEAQSALEAMKSTAVPKLVAALGDTDLNVKNRANAALISMGQVALVPTNVPLIDAISNAPARSGVTRAVCALGPAATPWLLMKLADAKSDAGTKACAIDILGRLRAAEAAAPIRELLNADTVDPAIRNASLVALGRLHHPDAFRLLREAAADPVRGVVSTAIEGFGELGDPGAIPLLQKYLFGFDENHRDLAVAALSKIGPQAVPVLAAMLKNERYQVRQGALRALQAINDPRVPAYLASALHDRAERVRLYAAQALGRPGDAAAVVPLLDALSDPAWQIAAQAGDSIAVVGAPAIPGLIRMLGQESHSVAAYYAQSALSKIGRGAVPALMAAVRGGNLACQQRAILVLGEIRDARAIRLLEQLSSSGSPEPLRRIALRALRQFRESRAG